MLNGTENPGNGIEGLRLKEPGLFDHPDINHQAVINNDHHPKYLKPILNS